MGRLGDPFRWGIAVAALVAALPVRAVPAATPTIEQLKARVPTANASEKPRLCLQIAERELAQSDQLYATLENEKGQAALVDVVTFSEMARDYAIPPHKFEKQTEIAVRGMIRKLGDMLRTLPHDDQTPLKDAIGRLERVRTDLLVAMFPKAAK